MKIKNRNLGGYLILEILISITILSILVLLIFPNLLSLNKINDNNLKIIKMNNLAVSSIECVISGREIVSDDDYLISRYDEEINTENNLNYIKITVKDKTDNNEISLETYYIKK